MLRLNQTRLSVFYGLIMSHVVKLLRGGKGKNHAEGIFGTLSRGNFFKKFPPLAFFFTGTAAWSHG